MLQQLPRSYLITEGIRSDEDTAVVAFSGKHMAMSAVPLAS